jgi:hypothetical protein
MVIFALSTDVVADCPAHDSTEKRNKNEIHSPRTGHIFNLSLLSGWYFCGRCDRLQKTA